MIRKNEDFDIENEIRDITKMISPIIIPLIDSLSELNIDDIIGNKEIDKEPVMVKHFIILIKNV